MPPFDEPIVVNTEFGGLTVDASLLRIWNMYGWPEGHVLAEIAQQQRDHAVREGHTARDGREEA